MPQKHTHTHTHTLTHSHTHKHTLTHSHTHTLSHTHTHTLSLTHTHTHSLTHKHTHTLTHTHTHTHTHYKGLIMRSRPVTRDVIPLDGLFHGFAGVIFSVLQTLDLHDVRERPLSDLPDDPVIYSRSRSNTRNMSLTETASVSYCSFLRRCRRMSALIPVLTEQTRSFHTNSFIDRWSLSAVSMATTRAWPLTCSQGSRSPPIAVNFYLSLLILNFNHLYNQNCSPVCVSEWVLRSDPLLFRFRLISAHLHTFSSLIKRVYCL